MDVVNTETLYEIWRALKDQKHKSELITLYIKVIWFHQFHDEPVLLYSELDNERFETRKIEFYRDNQVGIAFEEMEFNSSMLGTEKVPDLIEINKNPEFYGVEISKEEFEIIWKDKLNQLEKK